MKAITLNDTLAAFKTFADNAGSVGANKAVEINGRVIQPAETTACAFRRTFFPWASSVKKAININNNVRQAFLDSLIDQFCNPGERTYEHLPDYIKDALVGSNAKTGSEDFGLDLNGKVTSGKPLTARRIRAVMTAIENNNTYTRRPVKLREKSDLPEAREITFSTEAEQKEFIKKRGKALETFFTRFENELMDKNKDFMDVLNVLEDSRKEFQKAEGFNFYGQILKGNMFFNNKSLAKVGTPGGPTLADARKNFCKKAEFYGRVNTNWLKTHGSIDQWNTMRDTMFGHLFDDLIRDFNTENPDLKFF